MQFTLKLLVPTITQITLLVASAAFVHADLMVSGSSTVSISTFDGTFGGNQLTAIHSTFPDVGSLTDGTGANAFSNLTYSLTQSGNTAQFIFAGAAGTPFVASDITATIQTFLVIAPSVNEQYTIVEHFTDSGTTADAYHEVSLRSETDNFNYLFLAVTDRSPSGFYYSAGPEFASPSGPLNFLQPGYVLTVQGELQAGLLYDFKSVLSFDNNFVEGAYGAGTTYYELDVSPSTVPEPSTLIMLVFGSIGLAISARSRCRAANV